MTVQDTDISTPVSLPGDLSHNDTLSLQVRLSHMVSSILGSEYPTMIPLMALVLSH